MKTKTLVITLLATAGLLNTNLHAADNPALMEPVKSVYASYLKIQTELTKDSIKSVDELLEKIRLDAPHHLHSMQAQAPDELEKLLRTCLAKRPKDRPASAADLRKELEKIAQANSIPL